jgi:hypothetical protein
MRDLPKALNFAENAAIIHLKSLAKARVIKVLLVRDVRQSFHHPRNFAGVAV